MAHELRLTDVSAPAAGCCGGGACACGHSAPAMRSAADLAGAVTQRFAVDGMTGGDCVASVTAELSALGGVEHVEVALTPGAPSTVSVVADRALGRTEVRAAVEDAGYTLAAS